MPALLLVFLGGGAGAALRYVAGGAALRLLGPGLPYGTFFINVSGGLAMGLLAGLLARSPHAGNEAWRLLVGVGLLGGYTTFSTYSLETVALIQRGQPGVAIGYALMSALCAAAALWLGLALVRLWPVAA